MKIYVMKKRQKVNRPLAEVFSFFSVPENLPRITPPWLNFRVLTPSPIRMERGLKIDYVVSPLFFPMKWTSHITEYDPPRLFVDEQVRGPYALWRHAHRFEADGGGTWIEDEVRYALPLGFLGRIAHALRVKRQLEEIFSYRSEIIREMFPD